jgi:lipid II:glycine glycyltransferase (peptidoglycan interpeptide bridge formation enzyme)
VLLLKIQAKRGTFRLAPHAPIIVWDYFATLQAILPELKSLAKKSGVSFLRINGVTEHTLSNEKAYEEMWFRNAPIHMHAEETNLLTLVWTEDDMLKQVKKNTRYMINRAKREWVTVELDNSPESIADFIHMHVSHAKRTNGKLQYTPFSKSYIENLFTVFDNRVHVFNAYYEWVKEAACITVTFGKSTVYYLWASDILHPKFSPAYLCQRTAIQYARESWSTSYNFWWVSPDDNKNHPLFGVSFFKRSFGGDDFFLTHAKDYVFSIKYRYTRAIDRWRAFSRWYYYPAPKK